jgi:hypothetical protein
VRCGTWHGTRCVEPRHLLQLEVGRCSSLLVLPVFTQENTTRGARNLHTRDDVVVSSLFTSITYTSQGVGIYSGE